MDKEYTAELIEKNSGINKVYIDEPMRNHTSFRVGGLADLLVMPDCIEQLGKILDICNNLQIPVFIMGNGTNLVVMDKGIRGIVIKICDNFNRYDVINDIIKAQAGILLSKIADIALECGLSGLEFASGIPGTLGGAIAMNAGAYGGEMKDIVVKTEYMDKNGHIKTVSGDNHQFGYRTSFIQKEGGIILKSELKLKKGKKADIGLLMYDFNRQRRERQPVEMPSAGSVFKRPDGYFTAPLIEGCGLKGYRTGGAEVSVKHCGFIVNTGSATASDIISLIKHIKSSVKAKFGVELKTEVKIVGEE